MLESFNKQFSKPLPGTQIDWSHPLSKGLVAVWLFNNNVINQRLTSGYSIQNYVGDSRFNLKHGSAASPDPIQNSYGIIGPGFTSQRTGANASNYLVSAAPPSPVTFSSFTFAWCGSLTSIQNFSTLLSSRSTTYWGAGSNIMTGAYTGPGANAIWSGSGWSSSESGLTLTSGSSREIYIQSTSRYNRTYTINNKSVDVSSDYSGDTQTWDQPIYLFTEGYDPNDRGVTGNHEFAYLWFNRYLNKEEHKWIKQNPYDIFKKTVKHFAIFSATDVPNNYIIPSISGTAQVGQTLTTTTGNWTQFPTSYSYLWKHEDNSAAGNTATGSTYQPVAADIGYKMKVVVTATNSFGNGTATSSLTSTVIPAAPVNTVAPTISGPVRVGDILTATTGTWLNTPTSYTYLWTKSDGSSLSGTATNSTYSIGALDSNVSIVVKVTASNAGGSNYVTSSATTQVYNPYSAIFHSLSQKRFKKPSPGSTINYNHPLAQGLIGCWLFNDPGKIIFNYAGYAPFNLIKSDPSQQLVGTGIIGPGFKIQSNIVANSSTPTKPFTISSFSFATCGYWSTSDQYSTLFCHRGSSFLASGYKVGGSTLGQTWNGNGWGSSESNLTFTNSTNRAFFATSSSRYNRTYSMNNLTTKVTGSDFGGDTCTVDTYITIGSDNYDNVNRTFNSNTEYAYLWFNRFLSAEEQQYIRNNPYCFFNENKHSVSTSVPGLTFINTQKKSNWADNNSTSLPSKASWNMTATTKTSKSLAWNDLSIIRNNSLSTWNLSLSATQVYSSKYITWILYNNLNSLKSNNWNNLYLKTSILPSNWNNYIETRNYQNSTWNNYRLVSSKNTLNWNLIYNLFLGNKSYFNSNYQLNNNQNSSWLLYNRMFGNRYTNWNNFSQQNNSNPINWKDFRDVEQSKNINWNDFTLLQQTKNSTWNNWLLVFNDMAIRWNNYCQLNQSNKSIWILSKLVNAISQCSWNNYFNINYSRKINSDLYLSTKSNTNNTWNNFNQVKNKINVDWNLDFSLSTYSDSRWQDLYAKQNSKNSTWNQYNNINNNNKYTWNNTFLLKTRQNSSWGIRSIVGDSIESKWNDLLGIIRKYDITWDDLFHVINLSKSIFSVLQGENASLLATWDTKYSILRSLSILEELILNKDIQEFINSIFSIQENLNLSIDNEELLEGTFDIEEDLLTSQEIEEEL